MVVKNVTIAAREEAIHMLILNCMRSMEKSCVSVQSCGEAAFHGAHSDTMCLSGKITISKYVWSVVRTYGTTMHTRVKLSSQLS